MPPGNNHCTLSFTLHAVFFCPAFSNIFKQRTSTLIDFFLLFFSLLGFAATTAHPHLYRTHCILPLGENKKTRTADGTKNDSMRATRVPSSIAVTAGGVHYVVAAVNACASCQRYQRQQMHKTANTTTSPAPLPPFRFTSLLPEDWSALLRMCRRLTHPSACFNFSSPGDTAGPRHTQQSAASSLDQPSCSVVAAEEAAMQNHAYLHIVQRVAGDFTPNNMIYHRLQQFHLITNAEASDAQRGKEGAIASSSSSPSPMRGFTNLVVALQQQAPQAPQEVTADLRSAEDSALAARSAAEKRLLDPLASNLEAVAKSAENAVQLKAYTSLSPAAAAESAASTPSPAQHTFTFFPYPVSAAVSIPYCSPHFCVLVNLKPIVPHHLMVVPIRCVGTMHGLTEEEVEDWGRVMRCTIDVLEDLRQQRQHPHGAEASSVGNYSIAVQQGVLAGQTVAHLHVHVIPFDPRGKLAGEPETDEEEQRRRPPRTPSEMQAETDMLRPLFVRHAAATVMA